MEKENLIEPRTRKQMQFNSLREIAVPQKAPRRRSSGGQECIPAPSRQNPANYDEIPAEPVEKYRKILPESGPGGSPEPPESPV